MDFTEIYKQSLLAFSPGSQFVLAAVADRLVIRRTDSFQIISTWLIDPAPSSSKPASVISHIAWSCDSEYVLAACASLGFVSVYKLKDETWNARIDAGAEGLVKAEWAPDGRTILCFSEWGLRITVWSLTTGLATYIQYPIHSDRGTAFRADGRYLAVVERHKSKDTLGVYDASQGYNLVRHFPLPTSSVSSIALSPTGNHLAVCEGPVEYKLYILTLAGSQLASFCPDPDPGFGIRNAVWHPMGTFIAVSGRDDKIHILDNLSWTSVVTLELSNRVHANVTVWREPSDWFQTTDGRGFLSYERLHGTQVIPLTRADASKPLPKSGAVQLEWNISGTLLLARFENAPTAVHIYDFPAPENMFTPRLRTVLLHMQPVMQTRWNPVRSGSLAICCGGQSIFTWSDEWVNEGGVAEDIAECIGVPAHKFECRDLRWSPDGKGLSLMDKETFCCAFEVEEDA